MPAQIEWQKTTATNQQEQQQQLSLHTAQDIMCKQGLLHLIKDCYMVYHSSKLHCTCQQAGFTHLLQEACPWRCPAAGLGVPSAHEPPCMFAHSSASPPQSDILFLRMLL